MTLVSSVHLDRWHVLDMTGEFSLCSFTTIQVPIKINALNLPSQYEGGNNPWVPFFSYLHEWKLGVFLLNSVGLYCCKSVTKKGITTIFSVANAGGFCVRWSCRPPPATPPPPKKPNKNNPLIKCWALSYFYPELLSLLSKGCLQKSIQDRNHASIFA